MINILPVLLIGLLLLAWELHSQVGVISFLVTPDGDLKKNRREREER